MVRIIRARLLAGVVTALGLAVPSFAQSAEEAARNARIDALQAQLDTIQAELRALRAGAGKPATAAAVPAATAPSSGASAGLGQALATNGAPRHGDDHPRIYGAGVPTSAAVSRIDAGHPVIQTEDQRFTANLLAVMQFDVADYFQRAAGPLSTDLRRAGAAADSARARNLSNGTNFRRARIGLGGRAFGDFEYSVLFDFGGSGEEDSGHVQELWLQYSGWKPAHIRAGAFAPFIGLEDAGSTNGMMFLERPAVADIARGLAGGDYREAGQIAFTGKRWFASAAITGRLVNTAGSSTIQPYDSQLGFIARAGLLPFRSAHGLLHLGVHGSYVAHPADSGGPDAAAGTAINPGTVARAPRIARRRHPADRHRRDRCPPRLFGGPGSGVPI